MSTDYTKHFLDINLIEIVIYCAINEYCVYNVRCMSLQELDYLMEVEESELKSQLLHVNLHYM